jgi:hypothetical protein
MIVITIEINEYRYYLYTNYYYVVFGFATTRKQKQTHFSCTPQKMMGISTNFFREYDG